MQGARGIFESKDGGLSGKEARLGAMGERVAKKLKEGPGVARSWRDKYMFDIRQLISALHALFDIRCTHFG